MDRNTDMKDRILTFMKTEGIASGTLADRIHVQRSSISHILSGRNKPSYDFILKFLETFPNVNAEWFITGRGEMFKAPVQRDLFTNDAEHAKKEKDALTKEKEQKMAENRKSELQNEKMVDSDKSEVTTEMPVEKKVIKIMLLYDNGLFEEYRVAD